MLAFISNVKSMESTPSSGFANATSTPTLLIQLWIFLTLRVEAWVNFHSQLDSRSVFVL